MDIKQKIHETVTGNPVVLYMKGTPQAPQCGFSARAIQILQACGVKNLVAVDVLATKFATAAGVVVSAVVEREGTFEIADQFGTSSAVLIAK